MEITLQEIVFYVVAAAIAVFSVLAVTTGKILRAATYLLFVLFGTGAIYGVLGYTFLGAVQLMVYAGGIVVVYVFSILLTQSDKNMKYPIKRGKLISVLLTTLIGAALVLFLIFTNGFALNIIPQGVELPVREIGLALIGTEKYQFVLPFEVVSILLLACMIGAILIAITTVEPVGFLSPIYSSSLVQLSPLQVPPLLAAYTGIRLQTPSTAPASNVAKILLLKSFSFPVIFIAPHNFSLVFAVPCSTCHPVSQAYLNKFQ